MHICFVVFIARSAVTLLIGWQEGHLTCKELRVGILMVVI